MFDAIANLVRSQQHISRSPYKVIAWDFDGPLLDEKTSSGLPNNIKLLRLFLRIFESYGIQSALASARLRERDSKRAEEMCELLKDQLPGAFNLQHAQLVREILTKPAICKLIAAREIRSGMPLKDCLALNSILPKLIQHTPADTEKTWALLVKNFPKLFNAKNAAVIKAELATPAEPPRKKKDLLLAAISQVTGVPLTQFLLVDDEATAYKTAAEQESKCGFLHVVRSHTDKTADSRYLFALLERVCPDCQFDKIIAKFVNEKEQKQFIDLYTAYRGHKDESVTLRMQPSTCANLIKLYEEHFCYMRPDSQRLLTKQALDFLKEETHNQANSESSLSEIAAVYMTMYQQGILMNETGQALHSHTGSSLREEVLNRVAYLKAKQWVQKRDIVIPVAFTESDKKEEKVTELLTCESHATADASKYNAVVPEVEQVEVERRGRDLIFHC